jgi:thymidylate synthase
MKEISRYMKQLSYDLNIDNNYANMVEIILAHGKRKKNRTGVDTIGVFGHCEHYKVSLNDFPILTTKKVYWKGIVHELIWFLSGSTNIKYLVDNDVHIWDGDAYRYAKQKYGEINTIGKGPLNKDEYINYVRVNPLTKYSDLGYGTYGSMWRGFPIEHVLEVSVDQIAEVIIKLKQNPDDRRMLVTAWHPDLVDKIALPPCHVMFQFNTEIDEENGGERILNLCMFQRSCDLFLGVPFNISSYCLLLALVAHCVDMKCGTFTHFYGDLHIYENHIKPIMEQITRAPKALPKLVLNPDKKNIFDFTFNDIKLIGYDPHPALKAEVNTDDVTKK